MVDILLSLVLLILSPLVVTFERRPIGFLNNIFSVLFGRRSWVGYAEEAEISHLPKIKEGVLSPLNAIENKEALDRATIDRLNSLYAKDYHVYSDVRIVWKGWRKLGQ